MSPEFSWFNDLRIEIAYGHQPELVPEAVFLLKLDMPVLSGEPWDDNAVAEELTSLTWVEGSGTRYMEPYALTVRKGHYSWGADGATASAVIYIAGHVLDAAAALAALEVLTRLRRRFVEDDEPRRFLHTDDELAEYGEWSVRSAFSKWIDTRAPLTLVEVTSGDESWTGVYRDPAGDEYAVTLAPREGHPYRVSVRRRQDGHLEP